MADISSYNLSSNTNSSKIVADYRARTESSIAKALKPFSKFHVLCVLVLIFLGGNVKSHEAGLSVPDWPTSYGYNMFTFPYQYWVGGIWHEHVHRLVASAVGFFTVVLAIGVWRYRRSYLPLAIGMVVAVVIQGLLGGLTVILQLPAWTSSAHGLLAQAFLCMSVAMAFLLHHYHSPGFTHHAQQFRLARLLIAALFIQLAFGAFVRHTESGLAVLDFPTVAGSYIPSVSAETLRLLNESRVAANFAPVEKSQVLIHLMHRYWAIVVVCGVIALWRSIPRLSDKNLKFYSHTLIFLTLIQLTLGVSIIFTHRMVLPTSFHVVVGASMMALTMLILMRARGKV